MGCDGEGCPSPSWDDFKAHSSYCIGAWVGLVCIGVSLSASRQSWDVERTLEFFNPLAIFLTESKYYLIPMMFFSLLMCVTYLFYEGGTVIGWIVTVEFVVSCIHVGEVLVLCIHRCAQSQEELLAFAFKRLFIDCIVGMSVLMRGKAGDSFFSFSFAASLRFRTLWMLYEATMDPYRKGFKVKLLNECIKLLTMIFAVAALFTNLETFIGEQLMTSSWKSWEDSDDPTNHWTPGSAIYAVLCTISTVGYGDVQPRTILGQVFLMLVIVFGVGMVGYTVMGLTIALQHASSGGGEYHTAGRRYRRHIVVAGTPSAQTLKELLLEIYHPDHGELSQGLDTVIMLLPGQQVVMNQVRRFLHEKQQNKILSKVWLLQGSPLHRQDLARAKMADASMGYVLPNVQSADGEREDIENAMRALSMHRQAPYVRLIALLMKVEFKGLMASVGLERKDIACIDELKLGLMGKACEAQGFATLVCNLFKSSNDDNVEDLPEEEQWRADYCRGMGNELYEARLSAAYRGAPFGEVALDILQRSEYKAYMIGIVDESRYPGEEPITRIHPGRYDKIGTDEDYVVKGVFIAPDIESIQQHTASKPFSWRLDRDALGKTGGSMGGTNEDNLHPNELPVMAQRWLPDKRIVKRDYIQGTNSIMYGVACDRAVQGMKDAAHLSRTECEEILNAKVSKETWQGGDLIELEDKNEAAAGDGREKAVLALQLEAARSHRQETLKHKAEKKTREEAKLRRQAEKIVAIAMGQVQKEDPHKEEDRKTDEQLWGRPQSPRKALWGNPKEPPTSVLLRGEHIVVMTLEGNEDVLGSDAEHEVERAGRKLGLEYFMAAVRAQVPEYAQRPVVVLSHRVPYDWPKVCAQHKEVYLIMGRPLSEECIKQAGIHRAKAVVIYQRGPVQTNDPTMVDAQAIFGALLAEAILEKMGKETLVLVDLNLDKNHAYCKIGADKKDVHYTADELSTKQAKSIVQSEEESYLLSRRFVSGQLFASSAAITSLVGNMLYNPALGSLVIEMLRSRFIALPIPESGYWKGNTYGSLYEFMIRKRNLIVIALLRRIDHADMQEDEEDEHAVEQQSQVTRNAKSSKKMQRYHNGEPPAQRFVYAMPQGDAKVLPSDGMMCIAPKDDILAYLEFQS
jgi:hypothetical protein